MSRGPFQSPVTVGAGANFLPGSLTIGPPTGTVTPLFVYGTTSAAQIAVSTTAGNQAVALTTSSVNASARNWAVAANITSYGDFAIQQSNAQGGDPLLAATQSIYIGPSRNVTINAAASGNTLLVTGVTGSAGLVVASTSGFTGITLQETVGASKWSIRSGDVSAGVFSIYNAVSANSPFQINASGQTSLGLGANSANNLLITNARGTMFDTGTSAGPAWRITSTNTYNAHVGLYEASVSNGWWLQKGLGASGAFNLGYGTSEGTGTIVLTASQTGNVTINTPSSGVALTANGLSAAVTLSLGSAGANAAFNMGWNIGLSSTAWNIYASGTDNLALGTVGATQFNVMTNSVQRFFITSGGNATVNAPTSGNTLTLAGVAGNAVLDCSSANSLYAVFPALFHLGHSGGDYPLIGYNTKPTTTPGTYNYAGADLASAIQFYSGGFLFRTAPSGIGGNAITFTTAMQIVQAGNVTINAPSSGNTLSSTCVNGGFAYYATNGTVTGGLYIDGTPLMYIGTQSNHQLDIRTSAVARISMNGAGNVTINAPSGGSTLTVNGLSSSYCLTLASAGGAGAGGVSVTSPATTQINALSFTQSGQTQWQIYQPASSNDFRIYGGGDRLVISSVGNVTINAPTSGTSLAVTSVASGTAISATDGTVSALIANFGASVLQFGTSTSHAVQIFSNNSTRMVFGTAGNVTINAPSSGAALTVNVLDATSAVVFNTSSGTTGYYQTFSTVGTSRGYIGMGPTLFSGASLADFGIASAAGILRFSSNGGTSTAMQIANAGNVTINAPTSGVSLTVNQGVAATGIALFTTSNTSANSSPQMQIASTAANGSAFLSLTSNSGTPGTNDLSLWQNGATREAHVTNRASAALYLGAGNNDTMTLGSSGVAVSITGYSGTHSTKISDSATTLYNAGFLELPVNSAGATYTAVLADSGKCLYYNGTGATTYTIPANGSVAYPVGTTLTFVNDATGATNMTIAITTDTMVLSPGGTAGSRTLAQFGRATAHKVTSTRWVISGTGLT